jgi:hypothetical protein
MAQLMSRRAALAAIGTLVAGSVLGLGYVVRSFVQSPGTNVRRGERPGGGMMNVAPQDMRSYIAMFNRHTEINRTVDEIPGGVRTTTESNSPDLAARLQAHVVNMYARLDEGVEVMCMSQSLPTLFGNAGGYRRRLTFTPTGVIAEETADDPTITRAIRDHAREVTGFVDDGMPTMMEQMMARGGMMGGRSR